VLAAASGIVAYSWSGMSAWAQILLDVSAWRISATVIRWRTEKNPVSQRPRLAGDGPFPSDADDVYGGLGVVRVLLDTFVAERDLEQRALLLAVPDGELADSHGRVLDAAAT